VLTFIWLSGLILVAAIGWFAYRLIGTSAKEVPSDIEIANVGDLNKNNRLGKWGIDGL
jgi:hypothetical protein